VERRAIALHAVAKPQEFEEMSTHVMKVAQVPRYGTVCIVQVPRPAPKPDEVLIEVRAATVSAGDWRLRSGTLPRGFGFLLPLFFGLRGPRRRVLGTELSGVVAEVGSRVSRFQVGDRVFAFPGLRMGAHAEFVTLKETGNVLPMPAGLSFAEASAICFGGLTALYFLRDKAQLQAGERVLIVGAAGSVGSAAVELAKHFGAQVTGVCSTSNAEFVRSLGADHVIDYTKEDFTQTGQRYDVIMDCVGTAPFRRSKGSLAAGGRLLLIVGTLPELLAAPFQSRGGVRVFGGGGPERVKDMATLAQLCEQGAFRPRVGATFPFEEIERAHALVESGHKRGNAVLSFGAAE
jgi:NADPH:quinone reductase-like Zn-dependent oxidoreductase